MAYRAGRSADGPRCDQAAGAGVDGFVAVDATLGMGIILAILGGLVAVAASVMVLLSKDAPAATI